MTLAGFRACADPTTLALAPLTILAGANNTGKSSFVGALLSLVQSAQAISREQLLLNGHWVDLGPFSEVLSPDREEFSIGIEGTRGSKELSVVWEFGESTNARRSRAEARVTSVAAMHGSDRFDWQEPPTKSADPKPHSTVFLDPTFVITPKGPAHYFPYGHEQVHAIGPYRMPPSGLSSYRTGDEGSLVGKYGQHATEAFSLRRDQVGAVLPPGVTMEGSPTLARAMDAWLAYVLNENVSLKVEEVARLGYSVRLDTRSIANRSFGQVGFGLSQLWPILVAGLTSGPDALVVVDTPEAHLHPGAQHRIANLLVQLARSGRQVIAETHSEHVVAAACLAVKRGMLQPSEIALTHFSQPNGFTRLQRIDVTEDGRRVTAPDGFFDQSTRELLELFDQS